jgi:hypothetical protein
MFDNYSLTTDGQEITILRRGRLNTDSGPDFSHARIRIGDAEWVGNVEIHIHADEWFTHRHHTDKAYNNTILHVVLHDNKEVTRQDGTIVPAIEISNRIHAGIDEQYTLLKSSLNTIPCATFLPCIDQFTIHQVLDRVSIERLERKTGQVKEWLQKVNNDWHSVFYFAIARSFGFGTNSEAFEQLGLNLPLQVLAKHRDNASQIEALMFGTAGFLDTEPLDDYQMGLRDEWEFYRIKYRLNGLQGNTFKFMRMRPGNFPTLRIAQLAALVSKSHHLLSKVIEENDTVKIIGYFKSEASEYWKNHYQFGKTCKEHHTEMSTSAIQNLIINAVVPVLFVYGQVCGDESISNKAINLLHQLPAENNHIIAGWSQYGIHARTAFDSQALIELRKNHCDEKKCLACKIGHKVMSL